MDPLRLTRFFDGPMARSQATVSRLQVGARVPWACLPSLVKQRGGLQQEYGFVEDAPYEPQSQSRPFAKFEEGKARVVNMEETAVGGIFGRPATQVTVVPTYAGVNLFALGSRGVHLPSMVLCAVSQA